VFAPLEVAPDWIGEPRGNYWSQAGAGLKFRPARSVEIETLLTWFPRGRNAGAGRTFNLGARWLR
jgi:hypothetical protein